MLISSATQLSETSIMRGLIDVVMIANPLVKVIVGGYESFVSRLGLDDHPDWFSHANAGELKLAVALVIALTDRIMHAKAGNGH